jgi:hypothetical protein
VSAGFLFSAGLSGSVVCATISRNAASAKEGRVSDQEFYSRANAAWILIQRLERDRKAELD